MKRTCGKLTEKRTWNKNIEVLSKMLELYSIGILANTSLIKVKQLSTLIDDSVFLICTAVIWLGVVMAFICMLSRFSKASSVVISSQNGERLLEGDVRSGEKHVKKSGFLVALFIVLKLNIILISVSTCVLACNVIILKNAKNHQRRFNRIRRA